tara:strand:- start:1513 stop:1686 length:174 start_codon:yes stop_codon:yes gene_type:complete
MNDDEISDYDDSIWDTWSVDSFSTKEKLNERKRVDKEQDKNKNEHTKRSNKKHMGEI